MATSKSGWSNKEEDIPTKKLATLKKSTAEILKGLEKLDTKAPKFKGAIYGGPGTGKTVTTLKIAQALATEEKPGIIYVDTAENWASSLNHPELKKNVMRYRYTNWDDLLVLANLIHTKTPPFDKIGSFIIDEYNSYVEYDLEWITLQRSIAAEEEGKDYRDPHFPQLPDYLSAQHRSNFLLDGLIKLDCNILLVAHEGIDKDTKWTGPDMSAGARKGLMRKLHMVAYAEVNDKVDEKFTLRLTPLKSKRIHAKGRIGKLGDVATASQVIEAYNKWGITDETPVMEVKEKTDALPANESDDLLSEIN